MEGPGDETTQLGPLTPTPGEEDPPLSPDLPTQTDSSTSLNSESSDEDWLIKIYCPGARHRYRRHARKKKNLDKEESVRKPSEIKPVTSFQTSTEVLRKGSSELQWLITLRCPRAEMEQMMPDLKESFPLASASVSRSLTKLIQSSPPGKDTTSENRLTPKHFSAVQAIVNESQDISTIQNLLEREHCFVREVDNYLKHNEFLALRKKEMLYKKWLENVSRPLLQKIQDKIDNQTSEEIEKRKRKQLSLYLDYCNKKGNAFLETYDHLVYDPFFLKTRTDFLKVSLPSLNDPLLKDMQQRSLEARIIQQCDTGKIYSSKEIEERSMAKLPLSRNLMSPVEWLKVSSGYMESEIGQKRRWIVLSLLIYF